MSEVIVAFWTGTGNTAEMAEYVAEGIKEGGAEAKVVSVDDISAADLKDAKAYVSFQFVRQGFFCVDAKDSTADHLVFNRIVSLKSSFKLPNA